MSVYALICCLGLFFLLQRVHCGCIVSNQAYLLLDAGGVECIACVRKALVSVSENYDMVHYFETLASIPHVCVNTCR